MLFDRVRHCCLQLYHFCVFLSSTLSGMGSKFSKLSWKGWKGGIIWSPWIQIALIDFIILPFGSTWSKNDLSTVGTKPGGQLCMFISVQREYPKSMFLKFGEWWPALGFLPPVQLPGTSPGESNPVVWEALLRVTFMLRRLEHIYTKPATTSLPRGNTRTNWSWPHRTNPWGLWRRKMLSVKLFYSGMWKAEEYPDLVKSHRL